MSFLEERLVLDAALVSFKVWNSKIKGRDPRILCMLVLEKSYNHVNWGFLDYDMEDGFHRRTNREGGLIIVYVR